jgi:hypothetical protein
MMFTNHSGRPDPFGSEQTDSKNNALEVSGGEKRFEDLRTMSGGQTGRPFRGAENGQKEAEAKRELLRATNVFANFLKQQRARYYPIGRSLGPKSRTFLSRFFDPAVLGQVKIVELKEERIANPEFFAEAREKGYRNLPDLAHQSSVTFLDVIVFNEKITERALFHALVHVTQIQILGIERFAKLFVSGFQRSKSYFMIPLKAHAFTLDCQFAENRYRGFSVETEVVRWFEEGRY